MGRTGFEQSRRAGSLLHERAHLAHSGRLESDVNRPFWIAKVGSQW